MRTKYKILIAKTLSKFIRFIISEKQTVIRNKIKWNLDLNEGIDLSIYLFGNSEKKINNLRKIFKKKNQSLTFLDIGANIGSVSLIIASMFDNSKVFAIEPTSYAFNKLTKNIKLNQQLIKRVHARQLFLTNNKKPSSVWSSWNFSEIDKKHNKHFGTLKKVKKNSYLKLDEFIDNEHLTKIDFIKLDVDGYELDVLKSGEKFLKKNNPVIFMEIAPYLYPEFGYNCHDLINFLEQMRYNFFDENLREIDSIYKHVNAIQDGSTQNLFLLKDLNI